MTIVPIARLTLRPSLSPKKAEASAPKKAPTTAHQGISSTLGLTYIPSKIATITETTVCDGLLKVLLKASVVTFRIVRSVIRSVDEEIPTQAAHQTVVIANLHKARAVTATTHAWSMCPLSRSIVTVDEKDECIMRKKTPSTDGKKK